MLQGEKEMNLMIKVIKEYFEELWNDLTVVGGAYYGRGEKNEI